MRQVPFAAGTEPPAIIDTGLLVALFSPQDRWHACAKDWLGRFNGRLLTVDAVLTEAAYFLPEYRRAELAELGASGIFEVIAPDAKAYRRIAELLRTYARQDPDWADICLVWLAERSNVLRIVTVDTTDFSIYRVNGRNRFELVDWQRGLV